MNLLGEIFNYLIQTALSLFLFAVLIRLMLQLAKADFYNPVSQFVVRVTNPLLLPLRRLIPAIGRLDTASVVLALLVQTTSIIASLALMGYRPANLLVLMLWSLIGVLSLAVNLFFFAILGLIIFSWIAPQTYHPALALLHQLTEPVMGPFRRLVPPLGGLDLSPILVFIVINVLGKLLSAMAAHFGMPPGIVPGL
jgi:YggT family protein